LTNLTEEWPQTALTITCLSCTSNRPRSSGSDVSTTAGDPSPIAACGHQRVDAVIRPRQIPKPTSPPSGRLVGRLKHACGALEHTEHPIHLRIASSIARCTFDQDGRRCANGSIVLDDPAQPPPSALRSTHEDCEPAAIHHASRLLSFCSFASRRAAHRTRKEAPRIACNLSTNGAPYRTVLGVELVE
jgi:hypothetical protein